KLQVVRPAQMAVQLNFTTKPRNHRDERGLQASVAAATLAYTSYVLSHPAIDRTLIDCALTALVKEHAEDADKDWLPPSHAIYAQQYVLDELAVILKAKLGLEQ